MADRFRKQFRGMDRRDLELSQGLDQVSPGIASN
jgi:hypothetical protein